MARAVNTIARMITAAPANESSYSRSADMLMRLVRLVETTRDKLSSSVPLHHRHTVHQQTMWHLCTRRGSRERISSQSLLRAGSLESTRELHAPERVVDMNATAKPRSDGRRQNRRALWGQRNRNNRQAWPNRWRLDFGRINQDLLEVQDVTCWASPPELVGRYAGGGGGATTGHVLQLPSQ